MHDIWSVLIGGKLYCKPHPLNIATSWTEDCSNSLMLLILLHSFLNPPPQKKKDHLGKTVFKTKVFSCMAYIFTSVPRCENP